MKWTPIQTEVLKELCIAGISNAAIADHFGVPVREIHAKRSALGITIPKVKAMQDRPPLTVNPEFEAAVQEAEAALPSFEEAFEATLRAPEVGQALEAFVNAGEYCIVLARRQDTALIVRPNNRCTPFVVPLQHLRGQTDWWQGRYFKTLADAWAFYVEEIKQYAAG